LQHLVGFVSCYTCILWIRSLSAPGTKGTTRYQKRQWRERGAISGKRRAIRRASQR